MQLKVDIETQGANWVMVGDAELYDLPVTMPGNIESLPGKFVEAGGTTTALNKWSQMSM